MGQKESSIHDHSIKSESESDLETDSNNTIEIPREWYDEQLLKRSKTINFDVEAWYKIIESETFYTEFIPISPSIAQAFVNFFKTRYTSKKLLNSYDTQLIVSIQNQLKEQIFTSKTNQFYSNGAFIRLSMRSPKDGRRMDSQKINQFYEQKLNELQLKYSNEYESIKGKANMQIIASWYAQFYSLKVTSETEALNLILSSARVYHDLIQALDCQKLMDNKIDNVELHNWNNNIIVREWNNSLDPSMEFRCFVYQSNLTGISQYNYYCKYYHLQNDAIIQKIKTTIIKYWQDKIQPLLDPWPEKYSNYVIDIGLIENKSTNKYNCIVIEMNPFEATTHPCLFDWTKDNNQLRGQGNQIEIRVQLDYYPDVENYVEFLLDINQCDGKHDSSSDHPFRAATAVINQFIQERDNLIGGILIEGRSCTDQYRKLLEEFIKQLELELAKHLDDLQKTIQADKQLVFQGSFNNIQLVTTKAESARNIIYQLIEQAAASKRKVLIKNLETMSSDKTSQPLGYEQLRTLNLQVYSTVRTKKDIDNAKPHQLLKRTVYIGNNSVEH